MDMGTISPETWQRIIDIVALLAPILAAIPGLLALRALNKKTLAQAKKTEAESENTEASAADRIAKTALELLRHHEEDTQRYRRFSEDNEKVIKELREEFSGCKEQLIKIAGEQGRLLEENSKFLRSNIELTNKVKVLEETVRLLAAQLKELGKEPLFGKRAEDSEILQGG